MVDFELYRLFIKVADEKNITKASEKLHVSQPALTMRIKNLEEELNVQLFDRSKSGMALTEEGLKLYNKTKDSVLVLESAENIFNKRSKIRIATKVAIFSRMFGASISNFFRLYPEINLDVQYPDWNEMIQSLIDQKIDIAIYRKCDNVENSKIKFIKLGELEDVFFANRNYYKEVNHIFSKEDIKKEIIYLLQPLIDLRL